MFEYAKHTAVAPTVYKRGLLYNITDDRLNLVQTLLNLTGTKKSFLNAKYIVLYTEETMPTMNFTGSFLSICIGSPKPSNYRECRFLSTIK